MALRVTANVLANCLECLEHAYSSQLRKGRLWCNTHIIASAIRRGVNIQSPVLEALITQARLIGAVAKMRIARIRIALA